MFKRTLCAVILACSLFSITTSAAELISTTPGTIIGFRVFNDPNHGPQNCALIGVKYSAAGVNFGGTNPGNFTCTTETWYYSLDLSTPGGQCAYALALTAYSLGQQIYVQLTSATTTCPASTFGVPIVSVAVYPTGAIF